MSSSRPDDAPGWALARWAEPGDGADAWRRALAARLGDGSGAGDGAGDVRARWQRLLDRADAGTPVDVLLPAVGRSVGRGPLVPGADPLGPEGLLGTVDDLARALLVADAVTAGRVSTTGVPSLHERADATERRGLLRSAAALPAGAVPAALVEDALRANDTRLVAAAVGPCADVLDDEVWRQAVLKCLFVGVPLSCVHRLADRADGRLAEMAARYVAERVAAGRPVPVDVPAVLPAGSPALAQAGLDDADARGAPDRLAAAAAARALLGVAPPAHPTATEDAR